LISKEAGSCSFVPIVLPIPNIAIAIYECMLMRFDLGEIRWGGVDWIGLAQDRNRWRALVNSVLNLRVP
jgi:hypothetical protein